ncbi:MAG TPA: CAP domain-containing protein [Geodermatophilus sp.]|nr:CAP domain-containing protein [Geodermatophilus sp.]
MPAGPPLFARLAAFLGRWARRLRRTFALRGRVLPVLLVVGAVAVVALAVPMASRALTAPSAPVALESSASSSPGSSSGSARRTSGSVQMGVDGAPAQDATGTPTAPGTTEPPASSAGAGSASSTTGGSADEGSSTAGSSAGGAPSGGSSSSAAGSPPSAGSSSAGRSTTSSPADPPAPSRSAPASDPAPADAPVAPPVATASPGVEGEVLALVNEVRAAAGCEPLVADEGLAAVARAHSADMRDRDFFDHTNPDGLSPFDRAENAGITSARAENIARGQSDAAAVMADWMDSPGHRANIVDCELRTLGVGVARGDGSTWWTQLFGS